MLGKLARDIAGRFAGRLQPDARALNARGLELLQAGALDEAIHSLEAAIAADASLPQPHVNLANALRDRGELERALRHYDAALKLEPDLASARSSRATVLLTLRRYAEGWGEYEWRWRVAGAETAPERRFPQPRWDGAQPLEGRRILLVSEQGFGDVIQFARYAGLVAARGAEVVIGCQAELASLLRTVEGVVAVLNPGDPLPAFDYHAPLMSLPLALRCEAIPASVPYVGAAPAAVSVWRARLREAAGGLATVGIAWTGNPRYVGAREKSLAPEALAALARTGGCAFVSLQKDAPDQGLAALRGAGAQVHDWTGEFRDFSDTAACMSALDLVISVDTVVAHLAGALARPVWTLLPHAADWRWGAAGRDTPWYPTMRLFRQKARGDWRAPIDDATRALAELA